ncbi:MAG: TetR/AcrR family transcriptional regulator [Solirubrobacterales bacterium]|nr:TetR/AcrR family transcriptional regulator [Solirubrobacterales bacterium]
MNDLSGGKVDRRLRRAETEQRILDGTIELLDAGASLAGLSVNRIVKASGVSRATFYLHFADKRQLVQRLGETELFAFQRVAAGFLADPIAGRDELAGTFAELVELWRSHAGVLSSLIEMAEYDADSRETWQAVVQAVAASVAPALRERRPELDEPMVLTLSEILAWTGERALHQMVGREATDAQARRAAEGLTEAVWRIVSPASSLAR